MAQAFADAAQLSQLRLLQDEMLARPELFPEGAARSGPAAG